MRMFRKFSLLPAFYGAPSETFSLSLLNSKKFGKNFFGKGQVHVKNTNTKFDPKVLKPALENLVKNPVIKNKPAGKMAKEVLEKLNVALKSKTEKDVGNDQILMKEVKGAVSSLQAELLKEATEVRVGDLFGGYLVICLIVIW